MPQIKWYLFFPSFFFFSLNFGTEYRTPFTMVVGRSQSSWERNYWYFFIFSKKVYESCISGRDCVEEHDTDITERKML